MKNNKIFFIITICNAILLIFLIAFFYFKEDKAQEEKIVYVDNVQLFNDFNMSKDLNKINGVKINKQKKKLDSLYTIYGIFRENNQTDKLEPLEIQLRAEDQNLKKMNNQFSNEVSQAVWGRLNEYISEYGQMKGYKIIMGTQGSGNIMYAEDRIDITKAIVEFSNANYEGE